MRRITADTTKQAFIITGPTSGIGHRTALELAKHGTLVLVGRSPDKLADVKRELDQRGDSAVYVVCDLAEPASVRHGGGDRGAEAPHRRRIQQRRREASARGEWKPGGSKLAGGDAYATVLSSHLVVRESCGIYTRG